jgi:hypothetical protein
VARRQIVAGIPYLSPAEFEPILVGSWRGACHIDTIPLAGWPLFSYLTVIQADLTAHNQSAHVRHRA